MSKMPDGKLNKEELDWILYDTITLSGSIGTNDARGIKVFDEPISEHKGFADTNLGESRSLYPPQDFTIRGLKVTFVDGDEVSWRNLVKNTIITLWIGQKMCAMIPMSSTPYNFTILQNILDSEQRFWLELLTPTNFMVNEIRVRFELPGIMRRGWA